MDQKIRVCGKDSVPLPSLLLISGIVINLSLYEDWDKRTGVQQPSDGADLTNQLINLSSYQIINLSNYQFIEILIY